MRTFGEVTGCAEGREFSDRASLAASGIHAPTQAGISYSEKEGADSIVLSGGYADDEDFGNEIIYTGMGGRDANSGKQIADQELNRGNLGLAISKQEGLPVRVVRGYTHVGPYSPATGYRYCGLYFVDDYWCEKGLHGFNVWRYRLIKLSQVPTLAASEATSTGPAVASLRKEVTVQRIVRDTQVARKVKQLHGHRCQVCQTVIETPAGPYAEAAHIRPLGRPHSGPDIEANILCLCPNNHVMFDSGVFQIADDLRLVGIPGTLHLAASHAIDKQYLAYHREHYSSGRTGGNVTSKN